MKLRAVLQPNGLLALARGEMVVGRDMELRAAHSHLSRELGRRESLALLEQILGEEADDRVARWKQWLDPFGEDASAVERQMAAEVPSKERATLDELARMTNATLLPVLPWPSGRRVEPADDAADEEEDVDDEEEEEVETAAEEEREEEIEWNGLGTESQVAEHYGLNGDLYQYIKHGLRVGCVDDKDRLIQRRRLTDEDREALGVDGRSKWGYQLERLPGDPEHGDYLPTEDEHTESLEDEVWEEEAVKTAGRVAVLAEEFVHSPPYEMTVEGSVIRFDARITRPKDDGAPLVRRVMQTATEYEVEAMALRTLAADIAEIDAIATEQGVAIDWPELLYDLGLRLGEDEPKELK